MTTLCGCGKPTTHKGMCSARWAKRKVNNGPTGNKAKVEADTGPMSEEAIARRLFGDMADDILLLRGRGHTVARFKDGFRVDRDVLTVEQLEARAKVLRERPASQAHNSSIPKPTPAAVLPMPRKSPPSTGDISSTVDPDLRARVAQLEQRVEFLLAVVADAIKGRRECLTGQASGLAKLESELRESPL